MLKWGLTVKIHKEEPKLDLSQLTLIGVYLKHLRGKVLHP